MALETFLEGIGIFGSSHASPPIKLLHCLKTLEEKLFVFFVFFGILAAKLNNGEDNIARWHNFSESQK